MKSNSEERNKQIENNFKDYIAYRGVDSNNETKNLDIEMKNFAPNVENNNNNSEQNDFCGMYDNEYFYSKDFKKLEEIDEIFYEFISKNIANREFVKFIDNFEVKQNNASERTAK